jgi:hypothetical protein
LNASCEAPTFSTNSEAGREMQLHFPGASESEDHGGGAEVLVTGAEAIVIGKLPVPLQM